MTLRNIQSLSGIVMMLITSTQLANANTLSRVQTDSFGALPGGEPVTRYTLHNRAGTSVSIIDLGATIVSLTVADRHGDTDDVVLGFDNVEQYLTESPYFGAIVGRYANRIADGKFSLNGTEYSLPINNDSNHLHGGTVGFDKRLWKANTNTGADSATVTLTLVSEDGDQGYPGKLLVTVVYKLTDQNRLSVNYSATTDADTVLNLSQHSYFNLNGHASGSIESHELTLNAAKFTPIDSELIPTGELRDVTETPMDFLKPTQIGSRINDETDEQIRFGRGYDHNWVVNSDGAGRLRQVAQVYAPASGREMVIFSDQPGVQFYSGNFLDGSLVGKDDTKYVYRSGLCLETQHFPDSPNHPEFPSTVLRAAEEYASTTVFEFRTNNGNAGSRQAREPNPLFEKQQ